MNNSSSQKQLIADINRGSEPLSKPETWVLTAIAPTGRVTIVDAPDEKFVIVNPDDWYNVVKVAKPSAGAAPAFPPQAMLVDPYKPDGPETAKHRAELRKRVFDSLIGCVSASVQLNDVLARG